MYTKAFALSLLLMVTYNLSGQFSPSQLLENYRFNYLPEKVFVHTDKNIYAGGEDLWAAIYLINGQTHLADSISRLIHLELRNQAERVLLSRKVFPKDGHSATDLRLPANLEPGSYQLVAYTNFQRNSGPQSLFRKTIQVVSGLPESGGIMATSSELQIGAVPNQRAVALRFFPEGGDCVVGLPCRVAVVATGEGETPQAVRINMVGPNGLQQKTFQTTNTGVGTFSYVPQPAGAVELRVSGQSKSFPLPPALRTGIHLSVLEVRDTFRVELAGSTAEALQGATVLLHLRGIPLLERTITASRPRASFLLPKRDLPPGVITATVFNNQQVPLAERLFFVPPRVSELGVKTNKAAFNTRSPVKLTIEMPEDHLLRGSTADGRVSVSVIAREASGGPAGDDIRSWLLLNSDLDRPVPRAPALLFSGTEATQQQDIEHFLLTRAWRRFRWENLSSPKETTPTHSLEEGIYLRGRMTMLDNRDKARPGKIFLTRLENAFLEEAVTDEEGYFSFGPYAVFDTLKVALQGRFKWGKKNRANPNLTLDDNSTVFLKTVDLPAFSLPFATPASTEAPAASQLAVSDYQELSRKSLTVARTYDSLIIDLGVIDVVTKRLDPVEEQRSARANIYGTPDDRLVVENFPGAYAANSFLDLIRTVPGVQVTGLGPEAQVSVRGVSTLTLTTSPLFILDGQPTTLEVLYNIPVPAIEFIDVLKGATTSAFGSQGANGVILVYTKTGTENVAKQSWFLNTKLNGYHKVREFAMFDPELPENRNRPDIRTTLHWQPDLRTDAAGKAEERFLTSDQKGEYLIIVQGLRQDGLPVFGTRKLEVK